MGVKVTSTDGELATFDQAQGIEVVDGVLWVEKGSDTHAVYAAGKWVHADLDVPQASE